MKHILAIDQGTTGTKVLVMDTSLNVVAEASVPFEQHFPQPGWVEHDLEQIWASVLRGIEAVGKHCDLRGVAAIGITNQRETIGFWDRKTLHPLTRAIVWQDRRTAKICEALKKKGLEKKFQKQTGLLLDPYFSGTKISWAMKSVDAVRTAQKRGTLALGTIDTFILSRLTNGNAFSTEPSNASRTLLYSLTGEAWSKDLCKILSAPFDALPEVLPSSGKFGETCGVPGLPDGIPITGMLGDQQSALFGQTCFEVGSAKCTYGTGAFLLMNTGNRPVASRHRLLTTVAWKLSARSKTVYALEGSAFVAGAAIQWLRDGLEFFKSSAEVEALAASVPSSDGVVFVPALTGLGAPYWDPHARGLFTGLTRGTTRAHLARAALEGIALQNSDLLAAMQKDLGRTLPALNVDGGASANNLLMQIQSDLLGRKLRRPVLRETTSLGAVFVAGLGAGIWTSLEDLKKTWKLDREFLPEAPITYRKQTLDLWKKAVDRALLR